MIDLSEVPDADINREYWQRIHRRRDTSKSGRPAIMRACTKCGRQFPTGKWRKHQTNCTGSLRETLTQREARVIAHRLMTVIRDGRQWNVAVADSCLDSAWQLQPGALDSDFYPCTITQFTEAYRTFARRKQKAGSEDPASSEANQASMRRSQESPHHGAEVQSSKAAVAKQPENL